jgi:hypothetical protein
LKNAGTKVDCEPLQELTLKIISSSFETDLRTLIETEMKSPEKKLKGQISVARRRQN